MRLNIEYHFKLLMCIFKSAFREQQFTKGNNCQAHVKKTTLQLRLPIWECVFTQKSIVGSS